MIKKQILKDLSWRYATKKFDAEAILPEDQINIIKTAFNLTATSYGLQPIKLIIIKDKALQNELVPFSMNQQQIAQASHLLVFCIEQNISPEFISEYFKRVKEVRSTADNILKPFEEYLQEDFKVKNQKEIENWATKQAYLAMGNLLTVCAIERIDACPMEGFDPSAYNEHLNLNVKGLKSVLVMPIGYRAKDDMFADLKKVRKKEEEAVIEL